MDRLQAGQSHLRLPGFGNMLQRSSRHHCIQPYVVLSPSKPNLSRADPKRPVLTKNATVFTIIIDITFALLPWVFIWRLQMPQREKLVIAVSLSLGFLAGIAGIVRMAVIGNTLVVPVQVVISSTLDIALTLICVAVPTCMPLLRVWLPCIGGSQARSGGRSRTGRAKLGNGDDGQAQAGFGLHTFGGGPMPGSDGQKTGSRGKTLVTVGSRQRDSSVGKTGAEPPSDDGDSDRAIWNREQS
jgi:hypothetical protein